MCQRIAVSVCPFHGKRRSGGAPAYGEGKGESNDESGELKVKLYNVRDMDKTLIPFWAMRVPLAGIVHSSLLASTVFLVFLLLSSMS